MMTYICVCFKVGVSNSGDLKAMSVDLYQDQGCVHLPITGFFMDHAIDLIQGGSPPNLFLFNEICLIKKESRVVPTKQRFITSFMQ